VHDRTSRILAAFLSVALLLAAGPGSAAPQGARAEIEGWNSKFTALLAKGDAPGIAALYATGAQAFPPNGDIVSGASGIQLLWQGVIDAGVKGAKFTTLDVTVGGDLASETGKYEMSGAGGKVLDSGKYVVVWKREGGRWKILRDIWNTSLPAPPGK
jgi:ketosteroid isomerase-like protein